MNSPRTNPAVRRLVDAVMRAEDALFAAEGSGDMTPNNRPMSRALSNLVETVQGLDVPEPALRGTLAAMQPRLPRLHGWLSTAEGEMERCWSQTFGRQPDLTRADLEEFTYMDNYVDLTRREADACREAGLPERPRFMFVGSGPLPLSPIMLQEHFPGSSVVCHDINPEAVQASRTLVERLGIEDFDIRYSNGTDANFSNVDVLMVAALVEPKGPVIKSALDGGVDFVMARSARGANRVLYPPINHGEFESFGLTPVGYADSGQGVINTMHLFASPNGVQRLNTGIAHAPLGLNGGLHR